MFVLSSTLISTVFSSILFITPYIPPIVIIFFPIFKSSYNFFAFSFLFLFEFYPFGMQQKKSQKALN